MAGWWYAGLADGMGIEFWQSPRIANAISKPIRSVEWMVIRLRQTANPCQSKSHHNACQSKSDANHNSAGFLLSPRHPTSHWHAFRNNYQNTDWVINLRLSSDIIHFSNSNSVIMRLNFAPSARWTFPACGSQATNVISNLPAIDGENTKRCQLPEQKGFARRAQMPKPIKDIYASRTVPAIAVISTRQ